MTKYAGRGLVFSLDSAPIAQVTSVDSAGSTRALVDASAYGDDWKDYVVGQQDGDEMAVEIAYDPEDDEHLALQAAYDTGEPTTFGMSHDLSGWAVTIPGILTKLSRGAPRDGLLTMALSIKILSPGVEDESS